VADLTFRFGLQCVAVCCSVLQCVAMCFRKSASLHYGRFENTSMYLILSSNQGGTRRMGGKSLFVLQRFDSDRYSSKSLLGQYSQK